MGRINGKLENKVDIMLGILDDKVLIDKTCEELNELSQALLKYNYLKSIIPEKTQILDQQREKIYNEFCDVYLTFKYIKKIFNFNSVKMVTNQHYKIDKALKFLGDEFTG